MYKSILITIVALGVLATPCLAQKPKGEMLKNKTPVMTRFDRMSKDQLQQELKELLEDFPAAVISMQEVKEQAKSANIKFRHAPEDEKYDALLAKLEAEAALGTQQKNLKKTKRNFRAAQKAYKTLLMFEATGEDPNSSKEKTVERIETPLEQQNLAPDEVDEQTLRVAVVE